MKKHTIKPYKEMTPEERMVALAKDVLWRLDLGQFQAESGHYIRAVRVREDGVINTIYDLIDPPEESRDLQTHLAEMRKDDDTECRVCALGALLYSAVEAWDEVTTDEAKKVWKPLHIRFDFDIKTLALTEVAFEGRANGIISQLWEHAYVNKATDPKYVPHSDEDVSMEDQESISWWEYTEALAFHDSYAGDADRRLRAIMLNVVRNRGRFVVPQSYRSTVEERAVAQSISLS